MSASSTLKQGVRLANGTGLALPSRTALAPMTRCFGTDGHVPVAAMAPYYARRASLGLLISEGTIVAKDGNGYDRCPGVFTLEQAAAWKPVTEAVHAAGGRIFCQIWHVGRVSAPEMTGGVAPRAPSAVRVPGNPSRNRQIEYGEPEPMSLAEMDRLVEAFATGARHAVEVGGFDGVEIHGANGYLLDQFMHYWTNRRTDDYGGSPENMVRFPLRVIDAVSAAVGRANVGIRLSPAGYLFDVHQDERDAAVYAHLLQTLSEAPEGPLAYIHTGNFDDSVTFDVLGGLSMTAFLRQHYKGTIIAAGSYTAEKAAKAIQDGICDIVAFGRPALANPDNTLDKIVGDAEDPLIPYDVSMLAALV